MVLLKEIRVVNSNKEKAFNFIAQFANASKWDPGVVSSVQDTPGEVAVGTKYSLVTTFKGKESQMTYDVTEYLPNQKVVLNGRSDIVSAHDIIEFADTAVEGETKITYTADIRLKGIAWLATPFVYFELKKLGKDALDGMSSAFERKEHEK
uniref:Polyketide cyclase/dehydrase n=1 Tax=Aplanochytrium stocchinoi TaxID=215587 RepID=A0A7S3LLN1_9STRA|mmetsp:Transcript_10243/g.12789  ORF Transcript_10243/g.12789 Transcript_10243/m.12789 type:complete len:151 (-) Transcript_10243:362-814(-)